ncbi:MAG: hypothetical protein ACUZ8E_00005, partial [Candidatus Anammoxibacter sp.]
MLNSKEIKLLNRIKEDSAYSAWFFREAKHLKWFYPLKDQGYFSSSEIDFDKKGNASFWNVLDYLERVSKQVKDNNEYGKELLNIIEAAVHYSNQRISKRETGINNYHIWWYFVKIIYNLPPEIIIDYFGQPAMSSEKDQQGNVIDSRLPGNDRFVGEKFRLWLLAMKNPSVGGNWEVNDISRKLLPKFLEDDYPPEYAETIIEVITRIKVGDRKASYADRYEIALVWDAYWILEAFEKNHEKIAKKCSSKAILSIADKLTNTLLYKQQEHYANVDVKGYVCQIKVLRVPEQEEATEEIAFKENQYKCIVKQFSDGQLKDIGMEKDLLS